MQLIFSDQEYPTNVTKSIYLAGPSPRYKKGDSVKTNTWRHQAVQLLKELNYDGHVIIPLCSYMFREGIVGDNCFSYKKQAKWENVAMHSCDILLFNLDRRDSPGATTNIELGEFFNSCKSVYVIPNSLGNDYIFERLRSSNTNMYSSLKDGLEYSLSVLGDGVERKDGETRVPAMYFKSDQFQSWYQNQLLAGNKLVDFEAKTTIIAPNDRILFGFAAWVKIWITSENRYKLNEWVFSRTITSYTVPYYKYNNDVFIVLVSEFRSPANNKKSKVFEFPGGSSPNRIDPLVNASKELEEECGVKVTNLSRFVPLGIRQTFATFSTNQIDAYSIELTDDEFKQLQEYVDNHTVLGEDDEERITLNIVKVDDVLSDDSEYPVDLTTLGLLHLALNKK